MTKLHGKEIKVGDEVWSLLDGWQKVTNITDSTRDYPILTDKATYTSNGKIGRSHKYPVLFWEEMILTPKSEPVYEWQWLYWYEDRCETSSWYKSHEHIMRELHDDLKSRPLIRIEESKREVKP